MEKYGGAQQYVLDKCPGTSERVEFAQALLEQFPRREEVECYLFTSCPPDDRAVIVHVSDLGFRRLCHHQAATLQDGLLGSRRGHHR